MNYTERMADIATMLAADGYNLAVEEHGPRVALTVSRRPGRLRGLPGAQGRVPRHRRATSSASRAT